MRDPLTHFVTADVSFYHSPPLSSVLQFAESCPSAWDMINAQTMKAHPPDSEDKVLGNLVRSALQPIDASEKNLLCIMILLHTHRLTFSRSIFPTSPNVREMVPRTQREAASIVSCAFPQHSPTELYWLFNSAPGAGSFEVFDDVPEDLAGRVMELKAKLLTHADVTLVDPGEDY